MHMMPQLFKLSVPTALAHVGCKAIAHRSQQLQQPSSGDSAPRSRERWRLSLGCSPLISWPAGSEQAGVVHKLHIAVVALTGAALAAVLVSSPAAAAADYIQPRDPRQDLFTEDSWLARQQLGEYVEFVQLQAPKELQPGCEQCLENRAMLEAAYKTVAMYFFDPSGRFSQARWAEQLLATLQEQGGVLQTKEQTYRALEDMMATLSDRYSKFLSPTKFREATRSPTPLEQQDLAAQAVGTGIVVGGKCKAGGWAVEVALPASPAEVAGVRRGDCIRRINWQPAKELQSGQVEALLKGTNGTHIELEIVDTEGNSRLVTVPLRPLPQPPTSQGDFTLGDDRTARYIRVHYFAKGTPRAVRDALEAGERDSVAGYIIDLRSNSGGSFDAAVEVATYFLPDGAPIAATVTVRFGGGVDGEWVAGQLDPAAFPALPGTLTARPLVLLTNSATASASEVLVGALHDNSRAAVIGERTFGKGVILDYFAEPDGSGLEVTVAKYLLPSGYDVAQQGGIRPDLVCHDYPRGPAGTLDACIEEALQFIAGGGMPKE